MIGKYEFNSQEQAETKIKALGINSHTIVTLGNLVIIDGAFDENDVEITAPIRSELYAVDVIWRGLSSHPYEWKSYSITPSKPKHSFLESI